MEAQSNILKNIFAEHSGKVSDKWSIYLTEYDRLFHAYRELPIRLLEIGIQNGGSLEIWCKFFPKAKKLVGCDINPICAQLQFDDPKIAVVVADANTDETQQLILAHSPSFDLIIDDGSHQSGDIVRSFARYFSCLNDGGLYVAEDLHCSYWQDFEGGIFQPYSSIAFFKRLADIVNYEHWGVDKTRSELLRSFNRKYSTRLDEITLAHIHSIEFINSMCVIRKAQPEQNMLGVRSISGANSLVWEDALQAQGTISIPQNQSDNEWAIRDVPIEEELMVRLQEIVNLNQAAISRDSEISKINQVAIEREQALYAQHTMRQHQSEAYLVELAKQEKEHTYRLLQIQQVYEAKEVELGQQCVDREKIHTEQLSQARHQVEVKSSQLVEQEKEHIHRLLQIQQAYETKEVDLSQQYAECIQALNGQLRIKEEELINLTHRCVESETEQKALISQLCGELSEIRRSYSWRLMTPFRSLANRRMKERAVISRSSSIVKSIEPIASKKDSYAITQTIKMAPHDNQKAEIQNSGELVMTPSNVQFAATTLDELLSYYDERFIYCAYRTLLGRAPDPAGLRYYLTRVRSGVSKEEIVTQLGISTEGRVYKANIPGLDAVIRRERFLRLPFVGGFVGWFTSNMSVLKSLRAIENQLDVLKDATICRLDNLDVGLNKYLKRITYAIESSNLNNINLSAVPLSVADNLKMHSSDQIYSAGSEMAEGSALKVSVVVPNYNHGKYLRTRLETIYKQTYSNFEVILLDDYSSDGSVYILKEFSEKFPNKTICCFNESNSGGVFHQWKKGLELATGDLIWIAESDDFCSVNFLEELVPNFCNQAVMLSFCRSDFVQGQPAEKVWSTEEYYSDLNLQCWDAPFIKSAHWLINNAWAIKNIVPNVSSALFRNPRNLALLENEEWLELRLCGDWIFYLTIIQGGLVAYSPNVTNYYRQHEKNTSVNTQKEDVYYKEHEVVARTLLSRYKLSLGVIERQQDTLYQHWCLARGSDLEGDFEGLYSLKRAMPSQAMRKGNVVMVVYALIAGGGETFPLMLANLLKSKGYCVTVFNCAQQSTELGVRNMLDHSIPLLELSNLELVGAAFRDFGVELVHSHHAWADLTLASLLSDHGGIKQVVTMHGMYEMMPQEQLESVFPLLEKRISRFIYTARKNLTPFPNSFQGAKGFIRINNALAFSEVNPISRDDLGIGMEDFVLCLVSRAIPEKGWEEAIDAVLYAQSICARKIHIILIGEGSEFNRLMQKKLGKTVHFLGFRSNVRDYFSASDMGFIPSRFPGESFPLVLIDCLHSGKPVLASNVGEISWMLQTEQGLAGEMFDLANWEIPVRKVGELIAKFADDLQSYQSLVRRVPLAAQKFDPLKMFEKYDVVYQDILRD